MTHVSKPAGLAIPIFLLGGAAHAEVQWTRPNVDPYRGALDYAVVMMVGAGADVPSNWAIGRCRRRQLVAGERFRYMASGHGVLRDVVVRTDRWPASTPTTATDCTVASAASETSVVEVPGHLIRPDVCGNWAWGDGAAVPVGGPSEGNSVPSAGPDEGVAGGEGWYVPAEAGQAPWFPLPASVALPPVTGVPARVPEPSTLPLLAVAIGVLRWLRRRRIA